MNLCSHGVIVNAISLSQLMGCIGFSIIFTIAPCEHLHWNSLEPMCYDKINHSRSRTVRTYLRCKKRGQITLNAIPFCSVTYHNNAFCTHNYFFLKYHKILFDLTLRLQGITRYKCNIFRSLYNLTKQMFYLRRSYVENSFVLQRYLLFFVIITDSTNTKCRRQCCDISAMTLAILFSLKTMELLQIGAATHFQVSPLFSIRTVMLASSQRCRNVDADARCNRALKVHNFLWVRHPPGKMHEVN